MKEKTKNKAVDVVDGVDRVDGSSVGARLVAARRAQGLRLEEVSAAAGIGEATLYSWESGRRGLRTLPNIAKVARVLGVSLEWLATGRD